MKRTKRILTKLAAGFLALAMVAGVIPVPDTKGGEIGVVVTKAAYTGYTLDNARTQFPDGKYWNHRATENWMYADNIMANWDNSFVDYVSDTPCYSHSANGALPVYDCNAYNGNIQCRGFAYMLGYKFYGTSPGNWANGSINSIKPGDVLIYTDAYTNPTHTVFVIGVSGNTLTVAECNYGSNCRIKWNRTMDKTAIWNTTVKSAPENLLNFAANVATTGISLNKSSHTLTSQGATVALTATVAPSNATNKSVTWSSNNTGVATVDGNGKVTAIFPGNAVITAKTSGGQTATCAISVNYDDGWTYTTSLPSNITVSNGYEIQYKGTTSSSKLVATELKETYVPMTESDTCKLVDYYYYHYCGASTGGWANYEFDQNSYNHGDRVNPASVYVSSEGMDGSIPYYYLRWNGNGALVYCNSEHSCDGAYGTHGNRASSWYKMLIYQMYEWQTTSTTATEWSNTKPSNTTSMQYRYRNCIHTYDNGTVTKAATCTTTGVKTYTCTKCKNTRTEDISKTSHNVVKDNAVAATCTANGKTEGSHCSVCNAVITPQYTTYATGHSYNGGVITTAATCTNAGVKTFTCTKCNATTTEAVSATGHSAVKDKAVSPTCTTEGKTEGSHCSICGAIIVGQTTVSATGHNFSTDFTIDVAATTTTEGSKSRHCMNAGCTAKTDITSIPKVAINPTGVTLNITSKTLTTKGETLQLTATVAPSDATDKTVTWKSSNTAVATVDNTGKVTAIADGKATITVTTSVGSKTSTCEVTVAIYVPKNGLSKDSNGVYGYYVNDKIDTTKNGLVYNSADSKWYYLKDGKNDKKYVGLTKYNNVWCYVSNGVYNTAYNGLTVYNACAYSIKNGKLDSTGAGLKYCTEDESWYYLKEGKQDKTYTGLVAYNGSWWYVTNGKLNKTYKGLTKYNNGWYYVSDGKLNKEFAGLTLYNGVAYSVKNGVLANTANGLTYCADDKNWYYMKDGRTQASVTGLVTYNNDLWYVTAGKLDKTYKGLVEQDGNLCFVKDGKLSKTNGVWEQDGEIYIVTEGKVDTSVTDLKYHNGTWYYFRAGVVDWDYNTLAYANEKWWYVRNGELDKTYTGLVSFRNQLWYVTNGQLDKTYVGTCKYKGLAYNVKNGIGTR